MSNASSAKGSSAVGLGAEERLRMFKAVWSATARDYRGTTEDGAQAVLAHAKFGTGFVTAKTISEDELRERYAATQKKSSGDANWLDQYIEAEAAHYGLSVSQKAWLFDGAAQFTEVDEIADRFA